MRFPQVQRKFNFGASEQVSLTRYFFPLSTIRTLRPPSTLQSRLCKGVFDFALPTDQGNGGGEAKDSPFSSSMSRANASFPCLADATVGTSVKSQPHFRQPEATTATTKKKTMVVRQARSLDIHGRKAAAAATAGAAAAVGPADV